MGTAEVKNGKEVEQTSRERAKTAVEEAEKAYYLVVKEKDKDKIEVAKKAEQTAKKEAKGIIAEAEKATLAAKAEAKRTVAEAKQAEQAVKKKAKEIIAGAEKATLAAKEGAKRIIAEAEEAELAMKREAKKIIAEAEKAELAARQKAKREAAEAKRAKEIEHWAKQRARPAAKEKTQVKEAEPTEELKGAGIYEGVVRILVSGLNTRQFRKLEDSLRLVEGLDLLMIGSSVAVGTEFIVSADKPIPLCNILKEMQFIERVTEHGTTIQVTLKPE